MRTVETKKSKHVIKLANGVTMPTSGYGVYKVPPKKCREAVRNALLAGYRLIDTAEAYGNEREVGEAIRDSGIPREQIFLTTKIWRNIGEKTARDDFYSSLKALGTDYVDLCLIHMPFGDLYGTWRMLEQEYQNGNACAIGVSNFTESLLMDFLVNANIAPMVNQFESNPIHPADPLIRFCEEHDIAFQAWGPLGQGNSVLFQHPALLAIANKYGKTAAQVLLRFGIQRGIGVISKSVRQDRMKENQEIYDFSLSEADMNQLSRLAQPGGGIPGNPDFIKYLCSQWSMCE
ncbi:MAG: aldo/keto reductase [Eubacterium sp.]|nr:aldo/keto reductase [Eubacterium sp.]